MPEEIEHLVIIAGAVVLTAVLAILVWAFGGNYIWALWPVPAFAAWWLWRRLLGPWIGIVLTMLGRGR